MSGLVNAHCHLEYPLRPLCGGLSNGPRGFANWARGMATTKRDEKTIQKNIATLYEGGTTVVVDHITPGHPLDYLTDSPLTHINFIEVIGAKVPPLPANGILTPHSFYSVHPQTLKQLLEQDQVLSIHFLESADEREWWENGTGPLADLIRERGGDPIASVEAVRVILKKWRPRKPPLLVHSNYVADIEIELLKKWRATVVHCPGSHRYFGHRRFPLERLREAGVRIALGTDSLASNTTLDMRHEMELLKETHPSLTRDEIVRMATTNVFF